VSGADLVEIRVWFRLAHTVEVVHVDELKVKEEAGVGHAVLRPKTHVRQIAKPLVSPVVQLTYAAITAAARHCLLAN